MIAMHQIADGLPRSTLTLHPRRTIHGQGPRPQLLRNRSALKPRISFKARPAARSGAPQDR
jgi:hypothetical protein